MTTIGKYRIISILCLLGFTANAREGFFSKSAMSDLIGKAEVVERLDRSTVKAVSGCTGFYISKHYLLTAGHCVHRCLANHGILNTVKDDTKGYEVRSFFPSHEPIFCQSNANKIYEVKFAGTGGKDFDDFKAKDFPSEIVKLMSNDLDFALLYDRNGSEQCLQTSNQEISPNETLIAVGFPSKSIRKSGSAEGGIKYFSFGKTGELRQNSDFLKQDIRETEFQLLETIYNLDRNFVADIDAAPGNSGGPVVNPDGKVVGLVTTLATPLDNKNRYVSNSAIVLKMQTIIAALGENFKKDELDEIFDCKGK